MEEVKLNDENLTMKMSEEDFSDNKKEIIEHYEKLMYEHIDREVFENSYLDDDQRRYIKNLFVRDYEFYGCDGSAFKEHLRGHMKRQSDDDVDYITMVYIYCNWRVWATYEASKATAVAYQDVCDSIDDYIFDNWNENNISKFLKATD